MLLKTAIGCWRQFRSAAIIGTSPAINARPIISSLPRYLSSATVTASTSIEETPATISIPSRSLCRLEEFYDSVLAEDLMILSYDHKYTNPNSPYRKSIELMNNQLNHAFLDHVHRKQKEESQLQEASLNKSKKMLAKAAKKSAAAAAAVASNKMRFSDYQKYLDPVPPSQEEMTSLPNVYDRLPRIYEIRLRMLMPQAVSHSKRVLLNGLLALQLITSQQSQITVANDSEARLKVRRGMPIGVHVHIRDVGLMMNFLEKFVELVLPQVRDFKGFPKSIGDGKGRVVTLRMPAETWQAFPEIGMTYLKFPQQGSVGALQEFEVEFITTATTDEDARLLLSGYRLPISYLDPCQSSYDADQDATAIDEVQEV